MSVAWAALAQEGKTHGGYGQDVGAIVGWDGNGFSTPLTADSVSGLSKHIGLLKDMTDKEGSPLSDAEYKALHDSCSVVSGDVADLKVTLTALEERLAQPDFKGGGVASRRHVMGTVMKAGWDGRRFTSAVDQVLLPDLLSHFQECRVLRAAQLRFNLVVAHKTKQGRTMPMADMHDFPMLCDIHMLVARAKVPSSEDDDKAIKKEAAAMMDRTGKLFKVIYHGQSDVLNKVSTCEKRRALYSEKKQRQDQAQQAKKRTEAQEQADGKQKISGEHTGPKEVPLLALNHSVVQPWSTLR